MVILKSFFKVAKISRISLIPFGSNPLIGSSKINNFGESIMANPIANRCLIPKEKSLAFFFGSTSAKPTKFNTSSIFS